MPAKMVIPIVAILVALAVCLIAVRLFMGAPSSSQDSADAPKAQFANSKDAGQAESPSNEEGSAAESASSQDASSTTTQDAASASEQEPSAVEAAAAAEPAQPQVSEYDQAVEEAQAAGYTVVTGTFHAFASADECYAFQGVQNPNPGYPSNPLVVFVFDAPQTLYCNNGDGHGMRSGTATMVRLADGSGFESMDGVSATLAITESECWWPSDTGAPLGEPLARSGFYLVG